MSAMSSVNLAPVSELKMRFIGRKKDNESKPLLSPCELTFYCSRIFLKHIFLKNISIQETFFVIYSAKPGGHCWMTSEKTYLRYSYSLDRRR